MSNQETFNQPAQRVIELDIEGMTCASCVNRVERKLGKLEGVEASVNLPLESAHVTVPATVTDQQIVDTVNATGYKATLRQAPAPHTRPAASDTANSPGHEHHNHHHDAEPMHDEHSGHENHMDHGPSASTLRPRLILAAVLTVPVFAISMIPALQFANWGWVVGALALPVVSWAAWPFHRAAAINARHLASTMDTLVSIGVIAAYVYSAWQLFADPRMTEHPGMESMSGGGLYFEVAAVVTTFLLLGRYLEANAKAKAGNALKALLNLGAKDATILEGGIERKIPADQLLVDDVFVVRPGEKIATDGVVTDGASAVDASLVTGESVPVEVGPGSTVTGATINTSGRLLVRATRVGPDPTLAQ
ncbi:heavy metal translocating P-type ATPase, partial [Paenarthrobacter nicotinovorans]|uniref:heavy metal translocating P-type ATPase n=1 Tax=Paenarthrobacter nicotinovorans TaxID=29320 RepID=UPI002486B6CD